MVMEASPSPQSVGREFVRQYYTLLNKAPAHLHRFYNNYSSFVHGGLDAHAHAHAHAPARETLPVVGQKQIHNRIQQLNFRDCHAKISQVDSQATLGNGVVVQVTGELSNGGAPMRRFTQTFVLAAQSPKKYYVHNDIFRYQDIVFSDEEGSGSGRSEGEEDEGSVGGAGSAGYFPPPPAAFPAPAPAPAPFPAPPRLQPEPAQPAQVQQEPPAQSAQSAQPAQLQPEPPQPAHHLNGHPPQQHEDATRHLVSAMQATSVSSAERIERVPSGAERAERVERVEANPSPPPREPTPPPTQPPSPPPAAPEPKTYANLLKSGATAHQAARVSPPHQPHQPHAAQQGAPAPAPAPAPQYAGDARVRARLSRDAPPLDGSGNVSGGAMGGGVGGGMGGSRRYSDAQQLFLGNLPHAATEEELRVLFARFGPVHELRVHCKPPQPGSAAPKHPNYGFITYESAHAAAACLAAQPLYYPAEGAEGCVKLNVEEKKARAGSAAPPAPRHPRRPPSQPRRDATNTRPPYRR